MIISKEYGPQIDPSDGTCGETKLVKRWCLVHGEYDQLWTPCQGRYTYETEEAANQAIADIKRVNSPDRYPADLRAEAYWCWPGHFDPCCSVDRDQKLAAWHKKDRIERENRKNQPC